MSQTRKTHARAYTQAHEYRKKQATPTPHLSFNVGLQPRHMSTRGRRCGQYTSPESGVISRCCCLQVSAGGRYVFRLAFVFLSRRVSGRRDGTSTSRPRLPLFPRHVSTHLTGSEPLLERSAHSNHSTGDDAIPCPIKVSRSQPRPSFESLIRI